MSKASKEAEAALAKFRKTISNTTYVNIAKITQSSVAKKLATNGKVTYTVASMKKKAAQQAKKIVQLEKTAKSKKHATAVKAIKSKISTRKKGKSLPQTPIFPTNAQNAKGSVVFINTESESEDNTNTITQYPMDEGNPVSDGGRRDSKTVAVTAYLYGKKDATIRSQYNMLKKWQYHTTELTYHGKIYYRHLAMDSLNRSFDNQEANVWKVTFNLTFVEKVTYGIKGTSTSKGQRGAAGGSAKKKSSTVGTYITVHYGDTYWGYSQKYNVSVAQLRKWNGNEKTTMYPSAKTGKYPKKIRVK